jgi:hypothetical protein
MELRVRAPIPPGRYRLAVDLVEEHRFWLAELGNEPLERELEVAPRDASKARAHLADSAEPTPEWRERVRALHEEGYAAVGGALDLVTGILRRAPRELAPYAPGGGRNPAFAHPLLCEQWVPAQPPTCRAFERDSVRGDLIFGRFGLFTRRATLRYDKRAVRAESSEPAADAPAPAARPVTPAAPAAAPATTPASPDASGLAGDSARAQRRGAA